MAESRKKLLVVDDEEMLLRACRRCFSPFYDVATVLNPNEAIDLIVNGYKPDYILTDLRMPNAVCELRGLEGIKFIETLRDLGGLASVIFDSLKIALYSGDIKPSERKLVADYHNVRCFDKPFRTNELVAYFSNEICSDL